MFNYRPTYGDRLVYEPNVTKTFVFPKGNIFSAMDLLLQLEVDIASGGASNAPDFHVFNAIDNISLVLNKKTSIWSLSGQALAAMFTYDRESGVAAANNAAVAGSAASNVQGQHFLHCPFYPLDAINPKDFAVDTRWGNTYELKVKWKDITAIGTLFGTHTGAVTTTNSENYLDIVLHVLELGLNPINGKEDQLANIAPLVVGLREEKLEVPSSNTKYEVPIEDGIDFRNIVLYTTHEANTGQEVGENDIISEYITLRTSKNQTIQYLPTDMVRERTSQQWGLGSSLPNGIYDIPLTAFGNLTDVLRSTSTFDLVMNLNVTKQSNDTFIRPIFVSQERQVAI